jgi:hypothetical protein
MCNNTKPQIWFYTKALILFFHFKISVIPACQADKRGKRKKKKKKREKDVGHFKSGMLAGLGITVFEMLFGLQKTHSA